MRLIDANELSSEIKRLGIFLGGESLFTPAIKETVLRTIDEQPTVDAVPVPVKCGECSKTKITAFYIFCARTGRICDKDDFCSYGERKDGGKK